MSQKSFQRHIAHCTVKEDISGSFSKQWSTSVLWTAWRREEISINETIIVVTLVSSVLIINSSGFSALNCIMPMRTTAPTTVIIDTNWSQTAIKYLLMIAVNITTDALFKVNMLGCTYARPKMRIVVSMKSHAAGIRKFVNLRFYLCSFSKSTKQ